MLEGSPMNEDNAIIDTDSDDDDDDDEDDFFVINASVSSTVNMS